MEIKQLNDLTGKFLANKQIKVASVSDKKTILGNELLKVEYESGGDELLPTTIVERMISDEIASDLTTYQKDYCLPVIEQITTILLESGVKLFDVGYILDTTMNSLTMKEKQATDILYGGKDIYTRTIIDIDNVLSSSNKKENIV